MGVLYVPFKRVCRWDHRQQPQDKDGLGKQRCERTIEEYNRHKARCIELIGLIDASYQRALTIVYINYLSKAAAAEELGCSRTWLERRLKRGLAQLDRLL